MADTLDLDALDALEGAATKGPWKIHSDDGRVYHEIGRGVRSIFQHARREDAAFIAVLRNATLPLIAAARERDALEKELLEINEAMEPDLFPELGSGGRRQRLTLETIRGRARQLQEGLHLQNSAAEILQPPDDIDHTQWIGWVKEQAERIVADRARVTELERQRDDLHATNNTYLERARRAEAALIPRKVAPRAPECTTIDTVVEAVRADLLERSRVGIAKYGVTLDRTDLSLRDWLQHAYEEHLDAANYLKRAVMEIDAGSAT